MSASSSLPRPFEGNYGVSVTIALLALIPFIVVTTAYEFYRSTVLTTLGGQAMDYEIIIDLAAGMYAFGALVGGDLIQRFAQRYLFIVCETLFMLGCAIAAVAGNVVEYGSGIALQGLATGFLLVVALPPVIRQFPAEKLPLTAALIDLGFFGAIAVGPLVGGVTASFGAWRWLYAGLAVVAAASIATALVTLPYADPPNPRMRFDRSGVILGFFGTALPFWAVGTLVLHGFGATIFLAPFIIGATSFVALMLTEFHAEEPISPIKPMWNTLPIAGIIVASIGGGAYFTLFILLLGFQSLSGHRLPLPTGTAFWPQVVGALIAAGAYGWIVRTRLIPVYALCGLLLLLAGGALLLGTNTRTPVMTAEIAIGLLGLGAGATVAPGLWMASLSLQSKMVGRIFALVELIRSEVNFLMAPVVLKIGILVSGASGTLSVSGFHAAIWITLGLTFAFTLLATAIFLAGGPGLQKPDLRRWLKGERPAWESPELFALARGRHPEQQTHRKAS